MKSLLISLSFIALLSGCSYDNLEEMHPGIYCDTTGTISFANDILPIMTRSCGSQRNDCHNTDQSDSEYGLGTYDDVIFTIDDSGIFLETITHDPSISSSSWMPKGTSEKLDECSIQKIEAWINRGRLDN